MNRFLLLILILGSTVANAQHYFADTNAVWSVYEEKYHAMGDSVLNGQRYSQISISKDSAGTDRTHFALLREDSATREVFVIDTNSAQERLLYDFSANVNDTIELEPYIFSFSTMTEVIVERVDSVLIQNDYRKRIKVRGLTQNPFYDEEEYWIEGIGSTAGLLSSGVIGFIVSDMTHPLLFCYEEDGTLVYQNPTRNSCYEERTIAIEEQEEVPALSLAPNPASSEITLHLNASLAGSDAPIQIWNSRGSLQWSSSPRVPENSLRIDVSKWEPGVYFVRLFDGAAQFHQRLVIYR